MRYAAPSGGEECGTEAISAGTAAVRCPAYEKGAAVQKALKSYNYPTPSYTTAEGITSILNDVQTYSPAKRYAMIIGCHGMGWIPVSKTQSRSSLQTVNMEMHL